MWYPAPSNGFNYSQFRVTGRKSSRLRYRSLPFSLLLNFFHQRSSFLLGYSPERTLIF